MTPLPYTGERMTPWNSIVEIEAVQAHVMRYAWALGFVRGKRVADLGCGAGYGSFILSMAVNDVVGVDIDETAVAWASDQFPQVRYEVGDITRSVPDADVYVCFEVLEHLNDPTAVFPLLRGRKLIWSMPINDASRFHVRPYSYDEIVSMFPKGTSIFLQNTLGHIGPRNAGIDADYVLGISRL